MDPSLIHGLQTWMYNKNRFERMQTRKSCVVSRVKVTSCYKENRWRGAGFSDDLEFGPTGVRNENKELKMSTVMLRPLNRLDPEPDPL